MEILEYHENLQQEIALDAAREGMERGLPEAFTERLIGTMADAGFIDDGSVALYEVRGMRVSGFSVDDDEAKLHVFVTDYVSSLEIRALGKADVDVAFRRLSTFVNRARAGLWRDLEESSPVWDMAQRIQDIWGSLQKVHLVLLTNGQVRSVVPPDSVIDGVACSYHVWDIERLYRLDTSGRQQEPISVDFVAIGGTPVPCLGPQGVESDYSAFLLMLPGELLADIYERYGARLLELNVRSFLQARGKINKGIQDTLKNEPGRFLAYNNGISLTASSVEIAEEGGGYAIAAAHDLQIVNGGQTTASLHHARTKNKTDLSKVFVQAKLSVVGHGQLESLVPRISQFSNSQNPVNMADFSANDPFHVELEKVSRTVWAPGRDGSHVLTRWFYERARGQYADALAMQRTPARRKQFQTLHPVGQKFTKVDVAKYENTWDQLPHIVATGNQKNFREFTIRLKQRGSFTPDVSYFQRLVAKALIFRTTESLVKKLDLGGYRSQTVTYTLSLISNRTAQRINLDQVWADQSISTALADEIAGLAAKVHAAIVQSAGRANVGEWAKKSACWTEVQKIAWEPSAPLSRELLDTKGRGRSETASVAEVLTPEEQRSMDLVTQVAAETWFALASWAKQTDNLTPWQRGIAFSLGRLRAGGRAPSRKQVVQGAKILLEADRLGFSAELETEEEGRRAMAAG